MKKVKKQVNTTLTYTPFENVGELLKKKGKEGKAYGNNSHTNSNRK